MKTVLIAQSIFGTVLLAGTIADVLGLFGTIFMIFLFLGCQGFTFPNSGALSMAPFTKEAGSASALMGAIQMGLGALAAACVGLMNAQSAIPMTAVMAGCTLAGLTFLLVSSKKVLYKAKLKDVEEEALDMIEKY